MTRFGIMFRVAEFDLLVLGDANPDLVMLGSDVEPAFGQAERLVDEKPPRSRGAQPSRDHLEPRPEARSALRGRKNMDRG